MKRLYAAIVMAGGLLASNLYASLDYSDTGNVTMTAGTYEFGNGGEFTAQTTGIAGLGTFQTFCIEYDEEFGLGNTYNYTVNSGAVRGDGGAETTDPYTGLPMDNISIGTAWLYSQFRNSGLTGSLAINSAQAAGNFQAALWYLEGETSTFSINVGYGTQDGTAYFNAAVAGLTGKTWGGDTISSGTPGTRNLTGIFTDSGGAYGVVALNLFNGAYSTPVTVNEVTYNLNQDQLAIVPVPEPTTLIAGALLTLPFGASTLRILRKKRVA